MQLKASERLHLNQSLAEKGLRSTRQREHIFSILLNKRDHPSANDVYQRAKKELKGISLATVYNCLETLVDCKLVRQVNYEREPTRYCPNLIEHAHFYDENSGSVHDIDLPSELLDQIRQFLPKGYQANSIDLNFRGVCRSN